MAINDRLVRGDFRQVTCDVCGKESGEMYTTTDKGDVGDYDICVDCLLDLPYTLDEEQED
jgi:hypothetical protein